MAGDFAGRIEVGESVKIPTEFYDVNTGGTCNLLNVMVKHGIQNIIYSSTAAVYRTIDFQLDEFDEVQGKVAVAPDLKWGPSKDTK